MAKESETDRKTERASETDKRMRGENDGAGVGEKERKSTGDRSKLVVYKPTRPWHDKMLIEKMSVAYFYQLLIGNNQFPCASKGGASKGGREGKLLAHGNKIQKNPLLSFLPSPLAVDPSPHCIQKAGRA